MKPMNRSKLEALVLLATAFSLGHAIDHIIRDDLRWSLTAESVGFLVVTLVTYGVIAAGLYLYSKGKVGPRFWAILGGIAVGFVWLAHFSPFTDQPASYILDAYESATAGWLAVSDLVALMLVLIVTALYASYLWIRSAQVS